MLLERLTTGTALEQFHAILLGSLRNADQDGDGLDRGDIDLVQAKQAARARAAAVSQLLNYDLDGDLKVARNEIVRTVTGEAAVRDQQATSILARSDSDGDGVITLAEAVATARVSDGDAGLNALLALDPDSDGRLTVAELRTLADRAFVQVDADGDGRISAEERKGIEPRLARIRMLRSLPRCDFPALPAQARLVAYGAYDSNAVASVSIGGPGQETHFFDVRIEPGIEPLYLVLTSYQSMVWRLTGATDRLAHVVVASSQSDVGMGGPAPRQRNPALPKPMSASGVIGVARTKVTIAPNECPPFFSEPSGIPADRAAASIELALGRQPDAAFGAYAAREVSLPSGTITRSQRDPIAPPTGFDAQMWQEALRFWPGGLVSVNPREVIAALKVEPYAVLPSQMGLAQLIGAGAIEQTSEGLFRIVKPIAHLPARMSGAHSVAFILGDGVPTPPGDLGHSCFVKDATETVTFERRGCIPPPVVVVPRPR